MTSSWLNEIQGVFSACPLVQSGCETRLLECLPNFVYDQWSLERFIRETCAFTILNWETLSNNIVTNY